jgi:4-aminobutyrate aminotransferase-like enzyme/Ser/Thr protein kinase RdoA (MazF antagonist)
MTDMKPSPEELQTFLAGAYGIAGALSPLPGEHDLNYRVDTGTNRCLLKLHTPASQGPALDMQIAVVEHLAKTAPDLPVSRHIPTRQGGLLTKLPGTAYAARLLGWRDGTVWAKAPQRAARSAASLGQLLGTLDLALRSFTHPAAARDYDWDIARAHRLRADTQFIADPEKRRTVEALLDRFASEVAPRLAASPRQVIHNDANDYNVLLGADGEVSGLLDFGDMVESHRIVELAVAAAYVLIGAADPVGAILPLVEAYHAVNPLTEDEVELLFDLVKTRYAVSITMAARQIREQPENTYLLISQQDVWRELQRLERENARLATLRLRDACGFAPVKTARTVSRFLEANSHNCAPVIRPHLASPRAAIIDLSAGSADAAAFAGLDGSALDRCVEEMIAARGGDFGVGRYGENRAIYKGDAFGTVDPQVRRTVHLGIDIFAPAGEPVHAPLPGTVAFLHDDAVAFGFGPTVLLEHQTGDGTIFWTLYGHLSRQSLANLKAGQPIARGEAFAAFGAREENGQWPPHLHFQIVTDHLGLEARMHGVGVGAHWQVWRDVAPDPNVILGIPAACAVVVARDKSWLVRQRQRRIGRSLSIAYASAPLKIVGGDGAHLIDEDGTRWLDMVNNVCHVGHCHPRVVAAAQRQIARLNTNSRYLHDTVVEYADRLVALFPEPLSVCFFVNSGSEANDLAIRLARAYTGQRDLITVNHAYHGHLSSLIDVSPYKFNGRGGEGRPAHVRVAELPDPYRGRFRYGDAGAGPRYAEDLRRQVEALAAEGRKPALFFSEGILGTGGQIVPPEGYLREAYAHVRKAGGLCLADEVQVGFGRAGSAMWAFETQGVVPDIVTLGKPIGNGHPMAAVITTPEIANAFANGMEYFNTFGGNPVSAAIGLAVLDVIRDERLRHHCHVVGERLMAGARALAGRHAIIGDVRGLGLFNGIELVRDRATKEPAARELDTVIATMKARHRILLSSEGPGHNVLKIKPPAPFSVEDCDRFLAALDETLGGLPPG